MDTAHSPEKNNQEAKADFGKLQLTLVPTQAIRDIASIERYDQESLALLKPVFIKKTKKINNGWKGLFECPYCGKEFEAYIYNVVRGRQHSCGCVKGKLAVRSRMSHGQAGTRLYRIWAHILERCNNPNCKEYKWYGARGIKCEFKSYEEFRDYAIENGYNDNLTCERIDVNGNYRPGNVTFIPLQLQMRNMRSNVMITYKGLTLCAAEWAGILGVNADTLTKRKRSGWNDEKVIETPIRGNKEGCIDISLVPVEAISAIRETRLYGLKKYPNGGVDNWKNVAVERYRDALFRHLLAYLDDPDGVDAESGIKHYKHLICNAAFICALEDKDE